MRKIKTITPVAEESPQKRKVGAPRAQLFCDESCREKFKGFVARVMKDVYNKEINGYAFDCYKPNLMEGAAMMFLVLTEKGVINKSRTVRAFCDELTRCVTSLGYPADVVPARNHVGEIINNYTHGQERKIIVTGDLGEKNADAHRDNYVFKHHFYCLLCGKL